MWEKKPILLLILATGAIMVGTIITMVAPFFWVNTEADRIAAVKPYNALQLAGRDVYIREGCNNCHSQTVRPLVAEVLRYGPYSKSGEFVYDRPHLWGSRRMGPDLARVGGKYPDSWHYRHMRQPTVMIPESNMPSYAFLDNNLVDPELTRKKMEVLGFPYTEDEIKALNGKTEMDAMVAYLQKLGSDIGWRQANKTIITGELKNPYTGADPAIAAAGAALYQRHCAVCHGAAPAAHKDDDIGPPLTDMDDFGDNELFGLIHDGVDGAGMPSFSRIGADRIWKIINYLKSGEAGEGED